MPRSSELIQRIVANELSRVYDQPIGAPEPAPLASGQTNVAPPGMPQPTAGVPRTGNWLLDTGTQVFNRLTAEPPREYPGSWSTPQAYERSQTNRLMDGEQDKYGAEGITAQKQADDRERAGGIIPPARTPQVDTRNPLNPYAPNDVGTGLLGADPDAPSTVLPPKPQLGPAGISAVDARKVLPVASNMGWDSKRDFVLSNYPNLYAATQAARMTSDEVYDVVSFTLAVDAARTIAGTVDPERQRQLLMTMPRPQRALVLDVLTAMVGDAQRNDQQVSTPSEVARVNSDPALTARTNAGDEQNPVLKSLGETLWSPSISLDGLPFVYPDTDWGPVQGGELYFGAKGGFDALLAANENALRGANTLMLANASGGITNAWNATEAGSYDPEMIRTIKANNDPLLVDVMLTIKKLGAQQDEDPIAALIEKYGGNPQAMAYVDQILMNVDPDSDLSKLANEIDVAETSNLGNVAFWSLAMGTGLADAGTYAGIESFADSTVARGGSKLTNIGATFLLDPTIALTGVRGAAMARRYGLVETPVERMAAQASLSVTEIVARMTGRTATALAARQARLGLGAMNAGRLDEVFLTRGVRNYFNYLGDQFERIRAMDNVGDQAQVFTLLTEQNSRWFTSSALKVMMDAGVKDVTTARAFFDDAVNMEYMLSGQLGRRTKNYVVPHMTVAYASVKSMALRARGLSWRRLGAAQYLDNVFGAGTSDLMPREAA